MRTASFLLLGLLAAAGCGESAGGAGSASASSAPERSAPPKAGAAPAQKGCPEGTTEVKAGGFCIKVPKDAKIEQESDNESSTVFVVSSESDKDVDGKRINLYKAPCSEKSYEHFWDAAKNEIREKGEIEGGKGKFVWSADKGGGSTVITMLDTPAGKCVTSESAASSGADDTQKAVLAFGKTLSLPK